jgi:hypothetical protein
MAERMLKLLRGEVLCTTLDQRAREKVGERYETRRVKANHEHIVPRICGEELSRERWLG